MDARQPHFSVVTSLFGGFDLLARMGACLVAQRHSDWEWVVVIDGGDPDEVKQVRALQREFALQAPHQPLRVFSVPRAEGCYGNVARQFGLQQATGRYVCWVNHDNLIWPDYLTTHAVAFERDAAAISVVDIWLWKGGRNHGRFPRGFARSQIDLLCWAMPTELARTVDAFSSAEAQEYAADWGCFDRARRLARVEHTSHVVGVHF